MIRTKLLYAVLLVVLALFFILYRGKLSQELLIFIAVFPVLLWLYVLRLKRGLKVNVLHDKAPVRRGETYQWVLQLRNKSLCSAPFATADLEYCNSLDGEKQKLKLTLPVMPRNTQRIRLTFHAATCGVMYLRVTGLSVYDPLRLFRKTIRPDAEDSIVIMPKPLAVFPPEWEPQPQPDADSAEFSKVKAGDDPSEIFDLHVYREGDAVSRIHWKLSSKLDMMLVKEYSLPPDFRHTGVQPESALRLDTMLSCLSAAAEQLSQRGAAFRLASFRSGAGIGLSDPIRDDGEAAEWLHGLVQTQPAAEKSQPEFLQAVAELLNGRRSSAHVMLFVPRMDGELMELLLTLPQPERIVLFAVTASGEAETAADQNLPFMLIPVMLKELQPPVERDAAPERPKDEGGAAS